MSVRKALIDIAKAALIAISPKAFNRMYYRYFVGTSCNIKNPVKFSDKLLWLKLYWRDESAKICADKLEVRKYIKEKGYGDTLIPLIGAFAAADDMDVSSLPEKFVLKANHGSAWNIICRDKSEHDWEQEKKKIKNWLATDYYYCFGEWVYKGMKPMIVCEELLHQEGSEDINDYKILCFSGEPKVIFTYMDRSNNGGESAFYDMNWNLLPAYSARFSRASGAVPRPMQLEFMLRMARDLSEGFPHVRIDLYEVNGAVYFGEMTFFTSAGFCKFSPPEYDVELGSCLTLPERS